MSEAKFKACKQCGQLKVIADFRKYYGGRQGTYTMCKTCESINSREKYLANKASDSSASAQETEELQKIHTLWEAQREQGLRPPRSTRQEKASITDALDNQMAALHTNSILSPAAVNDSALSLAANKVTDELQQWLTCDLTEEPEYYHDEVYEELLEKYRPVKGIDQGTLIPIYDSTHKDILDQILTRFNNYEDDYYADRT